MEGRGEEVCVSLYAHHGPPWRGRKDARSILGRRLKGKGRHRLCKSIRRHIHLSRAVRKPGHLECIATMHRGCTSIDRSSVESLSSPRPIVHRSYLRTSGRRFTARSIYNLSTKTGGQRARFLRSVPFVFRGTGMSVNS